MTTAFVLSGGPSLGRSKSALGAARPRGLSLHRHSHGHSAVDHS